MNVLWVGGISGSGKTTLCTYLKQVCGMVAYDIDEDGLGVWVNNTSKEIVADPPYEKMGEETFALEWLGAHSWVFNRGAVEALREEHYPHDVIVCGDAQRIFDHVDVFDKVVILTVGKETLEDRLANRGSTNFYGKDPGVRRYVLDVHYPRFRGMVERHKFATVSSEQPVELVAADVLNVFYPNSEVHRSKV